MRVWVYILLTATVVSLLSGYVQASSSESQDEDWLSAVFKSSLISTLLKGLSDGKSKVTSKTMTTVTVVEPSNTTQAPSSSDADLYKKSSKKTSRIEALSELLKHDDSSEESDDQLEDILEDLAKSKKTSESSPLMSYFKSLIPATLPKPPSFLVLPDFVDFFLPFGHTHTHDVTTAKPCKRKKSKKKTTTTTSRPTKYSTTTKEYEPDYATETYHKYTTTEKSYFFDKLSLGPIRQLENTFDIHVPQDFYPQSTTAKYQSYSPPLVKDSYESGTKVHYPEELPVSTPNYRPFAADDEPLGSFVSFERKSSKVNITAE